MISILIPVFNTDIRGLIQDLTSQIRQQQLPVDICVRDDASSPDFRHLLKQIDTDQLIDIQYNDYNAGRSQTRYRLATQSKQPWLLFLDADSAVIDPYFLKKFLDSIQPETSVIVGGRRYGPRPADPELILHWTYGHTRESRWQHQAGNNRGFQTNNFLIRSEVFYSISFPEELQGYGHEDTWFGIQLDNAHIPVKHIDNAVLHTGIRNTEKFLHNTREAVQNLIRLSTLCEPQLLARHSRLYKQFLTLQKWKLTDLFTRIYDRFSQRIERNLRSTVPDLRAFDLYRLHLLISISR